MKVRACVCLVALIPLTLTAGSDTAPPREKKAKKDQSYIKSTFSPKQVPMSAASAGINQWKDEPHEWGQGAAGYGKRFASGFGKHIVQKSIQFPLAKLLHEEFNYHPSGQERFGPRLRAALIGSFIRHKTTTGNSTVAVANLSGTVGSGLVSRLWQPASTGSIAAGFTSAGITLAADTGMNVVREFWPEIRHPKATRAAKLHKKEEATIEAASIAASPNRDSNGADAPDLVESY